MCVCVCVCVGGGGGGGGNEWILAKKFAAVKIPESCISPTLLSLGRRGNRTPAMHRWSGMSGYSRQLELFYLILWSAQFSHSS